MSDAHTNFAYSTVTGTTSDNGTNPGAAGTSITVGEGHGELFPFPPFNATVWPTGVQPVSTNAEIVRVTAIAGDTLTVTRTQEGSSNRTIIVGDQIAATITAKTLTDAESAQTLSSWAQFIMPTSSYTVQTLGSHFTVTGTNSLYVFPVTIPTNLQFNQIIVPVSLSFSTAGVGAASNFYYSKFGLYSLNANTLSLISSSSFSIAETLNSRSVSWNYPTTTHTSGYGYGPFPIAGSSSLTTTAQMVSYISGTRAIGLQFGGNLTLTGGVYWLGLLHLRSSSNTNSTHGLSNVGLIGASIQNIHQVGTASGLMPIGLANSEWSLNTSHKTGWWGRHIVGFVTATSITNQAGTAIPAAVTLSALGAHAAASTATVIPAVSFVST